MEPQFIIFGVGGVDGPAGYMLGPAGPLYLSDSPSPLELDFGVGDWSLGLVNYMYNQIMMPKERTNEGWSTNIF